MNECKYCNELIADDAFLCDDCIRDLCYGNYAIEYIKKYFNLFKDYVLNNEFDKDYTVETLVEDFLMEDNANWIEFLWAELCDE